MTPMPKASIAWLAGALIFLLWAAICGYASDATQEPIGDYGAIDWVAHKVVASGIGVAPSNVPNRMRAKALAQRAAIVVAQRNLLEVVKGVHLDSTTIVEDFMAVDDKVVSTVKGILINARVEKVRVLEDGSIEVSMGMPLQGELAETLLQLAPVSAGQLNAFTPDVNKAESKQQLEQQATPFEASRDNTSGPAAALTDASALPSAPTPTPANPAGYTGLLIDARGTGFRPCLKPDVYGREQLVYPGNYIDQADALNDGYVRFFRNMDDARASMRISPNPYIARALKTGDGRRSLVVSHEAFDLLQNILKITDNFMAARRVVIVY